MHILSQIYHRAVRANPHEIERKAHALHPEGRRLTAGEDEQHPGLFCKAVALPQSLAAQLGRIGDLGGELRIADGYRWSCRSRNWCYRGQKCWCWHCCGCCGWRTGLRRGWDGRCRVSCDRLWCACRRECCKCHGCRSMDWNHFRRSGSRWLHLNRIIWRCTGCRANYGCYNNGGLQKTN